ncbi:MAG: transcription antitermination factor NusB [Burkholderiales bacterium]|jgi:N utilization substance protein B|nr:transcription antitermination factor NusB [Nitrosomonadaceae bacterium]
MSASSNDSTGKADKATKTNKSSKGPKTPSPRSRSRAFALQALYQWQLTQHSWTDIEKQFQTDEAFGKADAALFKTITLGAITKSEALVEALTPHLDRPWNEVSPIERSILLIGAFELTDQVTTPYRVIINEAIELAKSYGGTDGHKYVNGVLDKLAAIVRADEIALGPAASSGRTPARRSSAAT